MSDDEGYDTPPPRGHDDNGNYNEQARDRVACAAFALAAEHVVGLGLGTLNDEDVFEPITRLSDVESSNNSSESPDWLT